ncbi:MAG: hypothetical protein ACW98F_20580, partial [Candidatus Hodarchaeales archaeon]
MEYSIEAVYLSKEGLGLYTKTFDPNAPDSNLIAGLIKAVFDFSTEMIDKRLVAMKFEDRDENFASYLILERQSNLLLALMVRLNVTEVEKLDHAFRQKMKEFLLELVELSSLSLNDPIIDLSQYSFVDSLVFSFFFKDQFEKITPTDFQNAIPVYRPLNIVVGLNKEWQNRYSFYKSDPLFLELVGSENRDNLNELIEKMANSNL